MLSIEIEPVYITSSNYGLSLTFLFLLKQKFKFSCNHFYHFFSFMACSFFCYIKKFLSFTDPVKIFSCISSSTLKKFDFSLSDLSSACSLFLYFMFVVIT